MSPRSLTRLKAHSNEIILRWSDSPYTPALELPVEFVDEEDSEPIIRAPLKIGEATPVTLLGRDYTVNGIVRFCRADKNSYLITVAAHDTLDDRSEELLFRDPGALAIDDFLTEEEEAKILESLGNSARSLDRQAYLFSALHWCLSPFRRVQAAKALRCCPAGI